MENGTIFVTGGAKRIGAEICRLFANNGWRIIIHFRNSSDDAILLRDEIINNGGMAEIIGFDLANIDDIDAQIKELCQKFTNLRAIINNASIFEYDDAQNVDTKIFETAINVNCLAPILISQSFAKYSNSDQKRNIINILDQKLDNPNPDFFSYTISKYALAGAAQMLAMQMENIGIRINNISPGITMLSADQTSDEFNISSRMNLLNKTNSPIAIANAALMLINSNIATGSTIHVDCGQNQIPQDRDVMFAVRD